MGPRLSLGTQRWCWHLGAMLAVIAASSLARGASFVSAPSAIGFALTALAWWCLERATRVTRHELVEKIVPIVAKEFYLKREVHTAIAAALLAPRRQERN